MTRSILRHTTVVLWLVIGCTAPSPSTRTGEPLEHMDRTPTGSRAYHGLIQYRAKDAKQAIVKPTLLAAQQARLAAGTKVIGVFVNGEARAYPLFILNNHQIVNDEVGGTPVSASW